MTAVAPLPPREIIAEGADHGNPRGALAGLAASFAVVFERVFGRGGAGGEPPSPAAQARACVTALSLVALPHAPAGGGAGGGGSDADSSSGGGGGGGGGGAGGAGEPRLPAFAECGYEAAVASACTGARPLLVVLVSDLNEHAGTFPRELAAAGLLDALRGADAVCWAGNVGAPDAYAAALSVRARTRGGAQR